MDPEVGQNTINQRDTPEQILFQLQKKKFLTTMNLLTKRL